MGRKIFTAFENLMDMDLGYVNGNEINYFGNDELGKSMHFYYSSYFKYCGFVLFKQRRLNMNYSKTKIADNKV